jgi:pilus assembly protein CpaB
MRRRLVVLLAAAVLACFSMVAVLAYAHGADRRALSGSQGRWVLLATDTIPAGTTVAEMRGRKLVRQVLMPARTVPEGAIDKLDGLPPTQQLNAMLMPDQLLLDGQFSPGTAPTASPTPVLSVPAGKVAVTVDLTIARQVAGSVDPGDSVMIFSTYPKEDTQDEHQETTVLLPKVTVLSVGESPERIPTTAPTPSASASDTSLTATSAPATPGTAYSGLLRYVVTLAVSRDDAIKLVNAYNSGLLHLGLLPGPAPASTPRPSPTPESTP